MKVLTILALLIGATCSQCQSLIAADLSGVKPGPITVSSTADSLHVAWKDNLAQKWEAIFSLNPSKPVIASIAVEGQVVVAGGFPMYRCTAGKRSGGWNAFFDAPAYAPQGSRSFVAEFHPTRVTATTVGNRVEVSFNGMRMGIFNGSLRYTFYPDSSLIQQAAVVSASEPDVAYFYDAGLKMSVEQDRRPGLNMATKIVYYDPNGKLEDAEVPYGSERHTLMAKYRVLATKTAGGSVAVFPAPHRYLFARDYSTNLGFNWYSSWRGTVGMGIQEPPDDDTKIYPWMNAPPNSEQEMGIFFWLGAGQPADALQKVLSYTHGDSFPRLPGYVTFAPHWHFAFTVQAMANGPTWQPSFVPAFKQVGVDSALIFDFHIDGHPDALTDVRLQELKAYYRFCRAESNSNFLLIPGEEADVILGGHWGLVFPKPVYWFKDREPGQPYKSQEPGYGTVYRVHSTADVWNMVTSEGGYVYQTHPRTKGSTGYPDKILDTSYFRDPRYFGIGWKAMPSDLSSPRLGERAFKTLDDLNNLGLHKRMVGEDDLFAIHTTDELYSQMNINYVRMAALPDFDHYGSLIAAVAHGDDFITTGEIALPSVAMQGGAGDSIQVKARITSTFPLRMAEVVWGDGKTTHHEVMDLQSTHEFDDHLYDWKVSAPGWTWARFAVWDVAADGAFTNPIWREASKLGPR